jgi:hypothetical protein
MSDQDQTGAMDQDSGLDDATMGSPKGGSTQAGSTTGPGRYGGAEAADDANALEAGTRHSSGLDPMGGPGAAGTRDMGGQDAMTTSGGSSQAMGGSGGSGSSVSSSSSEPMATFGHGGTTAAPNATSGGSSAGEWASSQMRESTQPWGSGGSGEVH